MAVLAISSEIEDAYGEAAALREEVADILQLATQFSERLAEHAGEWRKAGQDAGMLIARQVAQNAGGALDIARGVGTGLGVAAIGALIAGAVEVVGGAYANWKREAGLRELLAKKQELARLKLPVLQSKRPRLANLLETFRRVLVSDAPRPVEAWNLDRHLASREGLAATYEAYVAMASALAYVDFMVAEMHAWLSGEHKGDASLPNSWRVQADCAYELQRASAIPGNASASEILDQLTEGALCLMRDPALASLAMASKPFRRTVEAIASRRVRATLFPFRDENRRTFLNLYEASLRGSLAVQGSVKRKVWWIAVLGVACVLATVAAITRDALERKYREFAPQPVAEVFPVLPTVILGPAWEEIFDAMSPEEHLAQAQKAMERGYDAKTRMGGALQLARRHYEAVSSDAKFASTAKSGLREINVRVARARENVARNIAAKLGAGASVRAMGKDQTTLQIVYFGCSGELASGIVREVGETLRSLGFLQLDCRNVQGRWTRSL